MHTILVVEDDKDVLKLLDMALRDAGYDVLIALSGEQALEVIETCDRPIHLLLADVVLPGMRGHQLAEHLRVLYPAMHVVFITGYLVEKIEAEIADTPNDLLITKPITVSDLVSKVRMIMEDPASKGTVPQ